MSKKEMINDIRIVNDIVNIHLTKPLHKPLRLAIERLTNNINSLPPDDSSAEKQLSDKYLKKTKQLLKLIDIVLSHYVSTSSAYADILNRCENNYDVEAFNDLVKGSKSVRFEIENKLKKSIKDYIELKE
jgi:hypothetical protein